MSTGGAELALLEKLRFDQVRVERVPAGEPVGRVGAVDLALYRLIEAVEHRLLDEPAVEELAPSRQQSFPTSSLLFEIRRRGPPPMLVVIWPACRVISRREP